MTFKIFFHPDFNCWYRSFNGSTFGCCLRVADFTASGDFHPAPEILTSTNIRNFFCRCTPPALVVTVLYDSVTFDPFQTHIVTILRICVTLVPFGAAFVTDSGAYMTKKRAAKAALSYMSVINSFTQRLSLPLHLQLEL